MGGYLGSQPFPGPRAQKGKGVQAAGLEVTLPHSSSANQSQRGNEHDSRERFEAVIWEPKGKRDCSFLLPGSEPGVFSAALGQGCEGGKLLESWC